MSSISPSNSSSTGDPQDHLNRKLLNLLQSDFPLNHTPFASMAESLGVGEEEILSRVQALKTNKVVRQISAIFDTRRLGYQSTLVAAVVDSSRVDEAAEVVSRHPGVSHNYLRANRYNLWFTLAVPPDSRLGLEKTVEVLKEKAGLEIARLLPSLTVYKIGVMLDMLGENTATSSSSTEALFEQDADSGQKATIDDVTFIRALQEDLPLISRPFASLAEKYALEPDDLISAGKRFIKDKIMRRFAAVLHHRKAGFSENIMGVWVVPEDMAERVGCEFASFKAVSHCYLRPSFEDWPYNMFTMLHGKSTDDLKATMAEMARKAGISQYDTLYSLKEYKKTRVKYFSGEFYEWETENSTSGSHDTDLMTRLE